MSVQSTTPVQLEKGPAAEDSQATLTIAIYTRKSVEADKDQEFNSLAAQYEQVRRYIENRHSEGWRIFPERYEDDGFTGANIDRPGFHRLQATIDRREVNAIAVVSLDRVSRNLADQIAFRQFLNDRGVRLISINEPFEFGSDIGALMADITGAVSEYERKSIARRTRDKVHEARRRGMWTGGRVPLGYVVQDKRLIRCPKDAERVIALYRLYLELGSLQSVVRDAHRRGWKTKTHTNQSGVTRQGRPIDKSWLHRLLRNPVYIGKMSLKDEVFEGEHEAIIDEDTWNRVQDQLSHNDHTRGKSVRNKWNALLRGLLKCGRCGATMGHTPIGTGSRRYRYYVCQTAQQRGSEACPDARVAAKDIEDAVVAQIRNLGENPDLAHLTVAALRKRGGDASCEQVARAIVNFDDLWNSLPTLQKTEVLALLLERVTLDPNDRSVTFEFREPVPFEIPEGRHASE